LKVLRRSQYFANPLIETKDCALHSLDPTTGNQTKKNNGIRKINKKKSQ
jgi:hypothetical protein